MTFRNAFLDEDRAPQEKAALVFLLLSWLISGLGAASPLADTVPSKLLLLLPPFIISVVLTLHRPRDGFTLWSLAIGFMVTQTGYQLAVVNARVSALEISLIFLLLFLLWIRRRTNGQGVPAFRLPGMALLLLFVLDTAVMVAVSVIRGIPFSAILIEFKGFVLYPFIPYVMVFGLRTLKMIRWATIVVVGWYLYVAAQGVYEYRSAEMYARFGEIVRSSGDYASINTYGITLVAVASLVLGIAVYSPTLRMRVVLFGVSLWLFIGAITAVSRTVWLSAVCGLAILFINREKRHFALIILVIGMFFFLLLPAEITSRIQQISDSSTVRREMYLQAGVLAWKARWLTGWGWGVGFWYYPETGLIPNPTGLAWYHNDYLILASQAGLIGLVLYVGYWLTSLITSLQWQPLSNTSPFLGYIRGTQMALTGLLVAAFFEHVLWKPDIAGLVGWVSGLMLTCMYLDHSGDESLTWEQELTYV